jgi:LPXTG-site transpeptidase (sortase) family protein
LAAAGIYLMFFHRKQAVPNYSITSLQAASPTPAGTINRGLPSQLVIPKLNIMAKVVYMGLTKNKDMETPTNIHDVGWYKYGAIPGNKGTAVMAGHLDGLKGEPGVFGDLDKLQRGDSFSVIDSKKQSTHFVVRKIQSYRYDEHADEVFGSTGGVHLNLITCTGAWDRTQHRFAQRLVVFADQST